MERRSLYLPFCIVFLCNIMVVAPAFSDQTSWTEEKIGKLAVRADKAAARQEWTRAIKYGEKMLEGSKAFYGPEAPYTVTRLKALNRYYDKAGRLDEISGRVKKAYHLSKEHFRPSHTTMVTSRLLYYKTLLAQKDFKGAIPLVLENISILRDNRDDAFKRLHYLGQLHGLYGATSQPAKQETTLLELLELNKKLVGTDIESNMKIIMNLAKSYCLQNKPEEFKKLMQTYDLKFEC
ncbi:hypothetical protein [Paremcibacter congregatus]|uniref:Tetratricopeptide repeat-like domain-containing protein n=1 Tax=Paremcibacter congregatus TaxID=2043170 RepID=A0A2G4YRY4_9PROT|nr:hypothetical protein [Paremcibacter congregatus]PHZ85073.1 hypothetical protein CRD36_08665 [Paremcibacter congregatus]QDE27646.1 hypothetical protein FIV45_10335 [Paremcibacter congregatus]